MQACPVALSNWAGLPEALLGTAFDEVLNWDRKNIRLVGQAWSCKYCRWWSSTQGC